MVLLTSYIVISCSGERGRMSLSNVDGRLARFVALQSKGKDCTYRRLLGEHLDLIREPVHIERGKTNEVKERELIAPLVDAKRSELEEAGDGGLTFRSARRAWNNIYLTLLPLLWFAHE